MLILYWLLLYSYITIYDSDNPWNEYCCFIPYGILLLVYEFVWNNTKNAYFSENLYLENRKHICWVKKIGKARCCVLRWFYLGFPNGGIVWDSLLWLWSVTNRQYACWFYRRNINMGYYEYMYVSSNDLLFNRSVFVASTIDHLIIFHFISLF